MFRGCCCVAIAERWLRQTEGTRSPGQGVNAFKTGNYSQAADEFHLAIDADPTFSTARLYLATAYDAAVCPGTDTAG